MKMCKVSDGAKIGIKALARRLIDVTGGLESAAMICRASKSSLGLYGRPDHEQHIPADVIADLEADAGEPLVTRELARLAGFTLAPLTGDDQPLPTDPARLVTRMARELGTFAQAVEDMDEDGIREPHEVDACIEAALDLQTRISKAVEELRRYRSTMSSRERVRP